MTVDLHRYRDYEALNSKHSVEYIIKQYSANSSVQSLDVSSYNQIMISCSNPTKIKFSTEEETSMSVYGDGVWSIGITHNPDINGQDIYILTIPNMIDDISVDTVIFNFIFNDPGEKMYVWLM